MDENHGEILKSGSILFRDDENKLSNDEKRKIVINYTVSLVTLLVTNLLPYLKMST